jgi:hypothetical protein
VITMAMIGKVKRMYFREKKSVREIVRLTSLSRNTVRKWLKAAVLEEPRYRRSEAPGKLTAHHETLKLALKADAHRPRHERRTARALHAQIRAPRRFVWNPTVRIAGRRRARWACGQAAFESVHMSTGRLPGARN